MNIFVSVSVVWFGLEVESEDGGIGNWKVAVS